MPDRLWVEMENGEVVECMTTEEAAQWIGVAKTTLSRGAYRTALESILRGRQRWWPVDKVMNFDVREFDGRYKGND